MQHPGFFERAGPFPLQVVAERVGAEITEASAASRLVEDVKALADAEAKDLAFFENRKYLDQLGKTRAGACLVAPAFAGRCPADTVVLETEAPYRAFAHALTLFYPEAMRSKAADAAAAAKDGLVHPSAQIEEGVAIEPGAVIGREARIGRGTVIAAGALVGYRVAIGRDCFVGPMASVTHALVGDGVVVHAGVRIGQDGFGFAMGPDGHLKVPQIGRVIIQDRVEIGANSTVDRGALGDTVIGEGTKIDNLVQIAHNVVVGRHCVIVAQTGISGSTRLGDFVVMGGQSGTVGHIEIGAGAQIAAMSHPKEDVPAGARMGGTPARPARQWARELVALKRLASRSPGSADREKS